MRPTDLKFRSPKQKTPGPYKPWITRKGRFLFSGGAKIGSSFGSDRRFRDYEFQANKLGNNLGPSSYNFDNFSLAKLPIRGGPVYLPYHNNKDVSTNAYYYIGDHIVYDQGFHKRRFSTSSMPSQLSPEKQPGQRRDLSVPKR